MKEFPLSKGRVTLVDDDTYDRLVALGRKWRVHTGGYAVRSENQKNVYLHRWIMEPGAEEEVDHKNRNRLDNRRENLRICTHKRQNQGNRLGCGASSGLRGVHRNAAGKKWNAHITRDGVAYHLGAFTNKIDAARAYNEAAVKHFGEFALLNPV